MDEPTRPEDELDERGLEAERQLENLSMEMALGLSECFEVLRKIGSGDLTARTSEVSENELVRKLEEVVNQTGRQIQQRTLELEAVNRELDSFVYMASHDLKEPLRSIETFSKFILDDYWDKLDDDGKDYLKRISSGASRLKNLIDNLLTISRITRVKRTYESIDTSEIVKEALRRLESELEGRGVDLRIRGDLPLLYGDRVKLVEVFYNLIANAIKYNDKEKPIIEIDCPAPRPKDEVVVYVRDNGIGIKEDYYDEVFKIFKRLHGHKEYGGGTGVGLAIVKRIIDEHHARVWIESKAGEGTTFYLAFPKQRAEDRGQKSVDGNR